MYLRTRENLYDRIKKLNDTIYSNQKDKLDERVSNHKRNEKVGSNQTWTFDTLRTFINVIIYLSCSQFYLPDQYCKIYTPPQDMI